MVRVKLSVVNRIQPQSNKFAMGVENEATGVSKLNESPDNKRFKEVSALASYADALLGLSHRLS